MPLCKNDRKHKLNINEKTKLIKKKDLVETKILVLGDIKVGKTSLLKSIQNYSQLNSNKLQINSAIESQTLPKILEIFSRDYDYDKFKLKITYIDSFIEEKILTKQNLKNIDMVYLCFDIFNINSFGDTLKWINKIKEFNNYNNKNVPILLIGCKSDIRNSVSNCIKSETFHQYALSKGAINFVECSSKTKYNIDTIIDITKTYLMKKYLDKCIIL
jgi:small GTP-binding protein